MAHPKYTERPGAAHRNTAHEGTQRLAVVSILGLLLQPGSALAQSPEAGERVFVQCRACHQVGETARNVTGPHLNGLFGRTSGSVEGYAYTEANKNAGITWTDASFREFVTNPRAKIPGTKMIYAGIKNPDQITNLIAYLKQFDASGKRQ
ncbi:c-type cytochrome [Neorhizobium galegae]|uniref:c-type cytochrome n=1 Tax=Neorhizobium galegae TaxID=399 RepID=UPI001F39247E|nr:cytochrome c family protein [Neorhizobium galegae]UIK08050.1 cytochrome c family protein [Neorhizobium galegae]